MVKQTETRSQTERPKVWEPPSMLKTPEPPEGFVYRWVRSRLQNAEDEANVSSRRRQGYEVVRPDDIKDKNFIHSSLEYNTNAGRDGEVRVGDLILMIVSKEIAAQRDRYYGDQARGQQAAIDNELRQFQTKAMPVLPNESRTRTNVGGRPVNFES